MTDLTPAMAINQCQSGYLMVKGQNPTAYKSKQIPQSPETSGPFVLRLSVSVFTAALHIQTLG